MKRYRAMLREPVYGELADVYLASDVDRELRGAVDEAVRFERHRLHTEEQEGLRDALQSIYDISTQAQAEPPDADGDTVALFNIGNIVEVVLDRHATTPGETLAEVNERRGWPREEPGLREIIRDEIVRLMYAGHGHPLEDRKRFCDYVGPAECPDCKAVDRMNAALTAPPKKPGGVGEYARKPEDA